MTEEISEKIQQLRIDYAKGELEETSVSEDPIVQFGIWMEQALAANLNEPYAMSLATCGKDMQPHSRIVLLRGFDARGFVFFTNYESQKGEELSENSKAGLCFFWHGLERQIRIAGDVERVSDAESDAYFNARPRDSRIGAWASPQSKVLKNREALEDLVKTQYDRFNNLPLDRPSHWGGFRVKPVSIEFWQGRPSRLHDRIRYRLSEGLWLRERLAP